MKCKCLQLHWQKTVNNVFQIVQPFGRLRDFEIGAVFLQAAETIGHQRLHDSQWQQSVTHLPRKSEDSGRTAKEIRQLGGWC